MIYRELESEVRALLKEQDLSSEHVAFADAAHLLDGCLNDLGSEQEGVKVSGWDNFNLCLGGFRPREFTSFCGTTGTGKTTFLANISAKLALTSTPHFVASVETGANDYILRVISALSGKDYNTGDKVSPEAIEALRKKYKPILKDQSMYLSLYTNKISPIKMLCDLYYANKYLNCKIAFLDNLNFFMPIVNARDSNVEMDRVIHDFIIFCKNVDMHIVMVMHPRKKEDENGAARVENENDIKGSSTVVQESHNLLLLNRPTKLQEKDGFNANSFREIKFAKLRRRGKYVGRRIMFENIDSRYTERGMLNA